MTPRAVIVSGSGRYADPWHPFPQTSACLAAVLADAGFEVVVDEQVDARLASLAQADAGESDHAFELLVVNVGFPDPADDETDAATRAGLLAYLASGRPLLVSHVSSTSFPAIPEWEAALGGLWVRGTTFHPEYGPSRVEIVDHRHPITTGLADFEVLDERYTALRVSREIRVLAQHTLDGTAHPLLWTHEYRDSRVVYDALGHDAASYDSAEHRELLRRAALWLTAG
jgi:type 1 glutamine amidotransferase